MSEDIKDIIEILELAKEEIENNDENITATLDLQDLKSLKNLYDLYQKEKEKNKKIKDGILFVGRRNGKSAEQKIILDEYISKDKIRERIKQKRDYIDKELQKANSSNNEEIKERLWCASAMLEELEQELLEERN